MILLPFLQGALLQASLILVIGPQNAYVLREGLTRGHVLAVAGVASLCDGALIALGAAGFGSLVAATPWLLPVATWGGVAFLAVYGVLALGRALRPSALDAAQAGGRERTVGGAVAGVLAMSLLNPHVYLDTVVLVGGLAGRQPDPAARALFAAGAAGFSVVWFFGLGYGARRLAPLLARPAAWRWIDTGVALTMWAGAVTLAYGQVG